MRTIKFRGKRLDNAEWVIDNLFQPRDDVKEIVAYDEFGRLMPICVYPHTVSQFTGLLDKNGREIYDGDIVSPDDWGGGVGRIGWDISAWCIFDNDIPMLLEQVDTLSSRMVVVGNIHDNPELLNIE